jgi:hypothetical protein
VGSSGVGVLESKARGCEVGRWGSRYSAKEELEEDLGVTEGDRWLYKLVVCVCG